MRRLSGQAARGLARLLHWLATAALAGGLMAGAGLAVLAWRLSQGPLDVPWLAARIESAVNADAGPTRLAIGSAALAWEGFDRGVDQPLDLRVRDVTLGDPSGTTLVAIPSAEVSVSLGALLRGRVALRAIALQQPDLTLLRAADGSVGVDIGGLAESTQDATAAAPQSGPAPAGTVPPAAPPMAGPMEGPMEGPSAPTPASPPASPLPSSPLASSPLASSPLASSPSAPNLAFPVVPPVAPRMSNPAATSAPTPLAALLAELSRPATTDHAGATGLFSQLRRVRIEDAHVVVVDRQLGATWNAPHGTIDLARRPAGGVDGTIDLTLALGDQQARFTATATLAADATETRLRGRLTPVAPAALARAAPALAPLRALDAPVGVEAALDLDAALAPRRLRLAVQAGAGVAQIGDHRIVLSGGAAVAELAAGQLTLETLRLTLLGHPGGPTSTITASGNAHRAAQGVNEGVNEGAIQAAVTIDLDQVTFADLPTLWPPITPGGARPWLVQNITSGTVHNGHFAFALTATEDLASLTLTQASGTATADGLTVYWLRPVPPVVQGEARLRLLDPDTVEIDVLKGRERLPPHDTGGLTIRSGRMRVTGLTQKDQTGDITGDIAGPVADAIALLRHPRLKLLDKHPIDLKDPAGQMASQLNVTLPLRNEVQMEDVGIHTTVRLDGLHLGSVVAGRDLDQGSFALKADTDGLTGSGRALLARIPARLDLTMDFRAGPATQVLQRFAISGQPDAAQLAAAGLDAGSALAGPVPLTATLIERRNATGEAQVKAELGGATLQVAPLGWRKPPDAPARASARLMLAHDRLTGIDDIRVDGEGVALQGAAECADGRVVAVRLNRLVLGRTSASGTLRLPARSGTESYAAEVRGGTLDLTGLFAARQAADRQPGRRTSERGPPWTIAARFDRVLVAHGGVFDDLVVRADSDGLLLRDAHIGGATGAQAPFAFDIVSERGGRRLTASAADAGALLRGTSVISPMQGGKLALTGSYDDSLPDHPLNGVATITAFRVRDAPALAKLLQAVTLYGLVDALRGPGLTFSRLEAPFRLTENTLTLQDVRAFSSSLGVTAQGTIDRSDERLDLIGTIVPAYFFNSLLGHIPLVGRLFSPERGGGVFAASYAVHGPTANPQVHVNPLAALTPGALRGLFKIF